MLVNSVLLDYFFVRAGSFVFPFVMTALHIGKYCLVENDTLVSLIDGYSSFPVQLFVKDILRVPAQQQYPKEQRYTGHQCYI